VPGHHGHCCSLTYCVEPTSATSCPVGQLQLIHVMPAKISLAGKYRPVYTALLQHVLGYKMLAMAVVETRRENSELGAQDRRLTSPLPAGMPPRLPRRSPEPQGYSSRGDRASAP
jgi:hypothetical protein